MNSPVWQNRDDSILNPVKSKRSPNLGPFAVMVCRRDDLSFLCELGQIEKDRGISFFNSSLYLTEIGPRCFSLAGPLVGAPYAVLLLETLIAWGASKVIFWGLCGAISSHVAIGDIIIPTCSLIDEGTSKHYLKSQTCEAYPSTTMVNSLKDGLKNANLDFQEGVIWCTDAIFRETREKVEFYRDKGAIAVEMETSALFTVGGFRGVEVGAILVVSDELATFTWRPGFRDSRLKKSREEVCRVIKALCQTV